MEEIVLFNPIIFEVLQQHSCCMMGLLQNGEVLQQPLARMRIGVNFCKVPSRNLQTGDPLSRFGTLKGDDGVCFCFAF